MLTMFTTCRPFDDDYIAACQRYALQTWSLIDPKPEVIISGNDAGVKDIAKEFGAVHLPDTSQTRFGTPSLSNIFQDATKKASRDVLMYTNADMLYLDDVVPAIKAVLDADFEKWLIVGGRWDIDPHGHKPWPIGKDGWQDHMRAFVREHGSFHGGGAIDYFIHTPGVFGNIPKTLSIGAWRWDNWMIWKALQEGVTVIDASAAIFAIHLAHPKVGARENQIAVDANRKETQGKICTTGNSGYIMTADFDLVKR